MYGALNFSPTQPVYNPDGSLVVFNTPAAFRSAVRWRRPLGTSDLTARSRLIGSVFADFKILEGLTFRTSLGADVDFTKRSEYISGIPP